MKKTLFVLVALIGLCGSASAQIKIQTQATTLVMPYKISCSSVQIGTTATEVSGNLTGVSTTTMKTGGNYNSVSILNLSTTATIYCNDKTTVASSGSLIGWPISYSPVAGPRNWFQWAINPFQKWYCITDAAAAVSAMVCVGK